MNKKKIANLAPYGYITPITVILIGFVIVSVIISIVLSFTRYNIMTPPTFYGLKNYERLVTDTKFMKALFNTLKLMVMIVPLQMILSLIVSVFLVSHRHMLIGKISALKVFNQPRFLIIKNNGIIITSDGTTIVMIKKMNNLSFPLKSIFANAYPASEHTVTVRITPTTATNTLLNT
jgi:ABC-type sugar transport system permease subunit